MNQRIKRIKQSQIRLETLFRNEKKDLNLELSIRREGLRVPLRVEKECEGHYVLVDGYRRFYALEFLGVVETECIIEEQTSPYERIIKRLNVELHTKRRTSYDLEKMINSLLEDYSYDTKRIAAQCNVTEATIYKYIRGKDVNPDWIRRSEVTKPGRHGLTEIHYLDINNETKEYIVDKYIERKINKTVVDTIKKASKENAFMTIPEEKINGCIDQIIKQHSQQFENVKEIIHVNKLQEEYDKESHKFLYNSAMTSLRWIAELFGNRNFINYLTNKQKKEMKKSLEDLLKLLSLPIKRTKFPKDTLYIVKELKPNNEEEKSI